MSNISAELVLHSLIFLCPKTATDAKEPEVTGLYPELNRLLFGDWLPHDGFRLELAPFWLLVSDYCLPTDVLDGDYSFRTQHFRV
ncbi:TPA: hypothetical protein H2R31_004640 [Salmonella enterica]|nr:hypothetical protein [Salmonella enterica]